MHFHIGTSGWDYPHWRGVIYPETLPAQARLAFCIYDLAGFASRRAVTADFVYLRLHGPGAAYRGRYGHTALAGWAHWLGAQTVAAAYVYFDNDEAAHAVQDALTLKAMLA